MARRIIWSRRSQSDRKAIFAYWNSRNKSKVYSKKLNGLFILAVEFISKHPHTGRKTSREDVRIKFVPHFAVIYELDNSELRVLAIFDTRQDPGKLEEIIEK